MWRNLSGLECCKRINDRLLIFTWPPDSAGFFRALRKQVELFSPCSIVTYNAGPSTPSLLSESGLSSFEPRWLNHRPTVLPSTQVLGRVCLAKVLQHLARSRLAQSPFSKYSALACLVAGISDFHRLKTFIQSETLKSCRDERVAWTPRGRPDGWRWEHG
jgi:hypothetical protein